MTDCEFIKRVLLLLDEVDYKMIINEAYARGYVVPGFSNCKGKKNKSTPPVSSAVGNKTLNAKNKRGNYNYEIIFDAIKIVAEKKENQNELLDFVIKWEEDGNSHDEIEKELLNFEEKELQIKQDNEKVISNDDTEEYDCKNKKNDRIDESIFEEYKTEIEALKTRNKKYKEELQYIKIEKDNLLQKILRMEKDYANLKNEYENITQKNMELNFILENNNKEFNVKLKEANLSIDNLKKEIEELNIQNNNLKQYKNKAPNILCFSKRKLKEEISGYNIDNEVFISEDFESYFKKSYEEIWIIRKEFTYAEKIMLGDIENKIKEKNLNIVVLNVKDERELIEKINGGM